MATQPYVLDSRRTALAIAYENKELIADRVMPYVGVPSTKFEWTEYNEAQYFSIPDTSIGRLSKPNQIEFSSTVKDARCEDFGLMDVVPVKDVEEAPPGWDPLTNAIMMLRSVNALDREKKVADAVFSASNHTNNTTLSGSSQWSHPDSRPATAIMDALDVPLQRPNKIIFGETAWRHFRRHPEVVQNIYTSGPGVGTASGAAGNVSRMQVADWLEVDEILVGRSWFNTAKTGQTPTYSKVWGKHCALLYLNSDISLNTKLMTWGFTGRFGNRRADQYMDNTIGAMGAYVVRESECRKEVISAKGASYLFVNAVA